MARSKLYFAIVVVSFTLFAVVSLAEVDVTEEAAETAVALTDRATDVDPLTKLPLHRPVNRRIPLKDADAIPAGEIPSVSSGEFENPLFHHNHHHLHLHRHHHHHFYDDHHRHHEDTDSDDDDDDEDHSLKKKAKKKLRHGHGELSGEERMTSAKKTKKHCHGFIKRLINFFDHYF